MIHKKTKTMLIDIFFELAGSFLIAIALYNFALNASFPMSGFSGIALIFYRLYSFPIGITTILLNIPVAFFCFRLLGTGFFVRSLRCMVISSVMVDWIAPFLPLYSGSRMLSAVCTGIFSGLGYAMIYMRNSSTGGADFIIMSVKALRPHLSLGKIAFLADAGIVIAGGLIFDDVDGIIYGLIINYIMAAVIDKVMYGIDAGKVALIVSPHGEQIAKTIDECCKRGSTLLSASGGYNQENKHVVLCACNNKEMYLLQTAVRQADPDCFVIILESNEVLGQGFK